MDDKLVGELRRMFLDGATPSQLMNHIANQHGDGSRLHFTIKDYFREAFGIQLLRNVISGEDYSPNCHHAHFNRDVAPEMVQRIGDWNHATLEGSWLADIDIKSLSDHVERLNSAHFEELERVWANLNDKEKLFIIRKIATKDYYWEVMKLLASMAERLQQKVVDLEERLKRESGVAQLD